ncbi:MAG: hypothetical protein O9272_02560, partial [Brevundimonas sp.]|nr:hypothetical protein [Brevundimonas sp.]
MKVFSQERLRDIANTVSEKVKTAQDGISYFDEPFKHIVIDDCFDRDLAESCFASFPSIEDSCWEKANDLDIEVKYRT